MGVHETHCCSTHGCKYGDPGCPVELGLIKQRYKCEFCKDEEFYDDFEIDDEYEYKYEMFFKSEPDDFIKIDGWYPIDENRIKHKDRIQEYIDNGILRLINKNV